MRKENKYLICGFSLIALYYLYFRFVWFNTSKASKHLAHISEDLKALCKRYNYPFVAVVGAIIMQESSGNPNIDGASGEIGLMQIMPNTFNALDKIYGFRFGFSDLYNPRLNMVVGIHLLKYLREKGLSIKNQIRAFNVGEDLKPTDKAQIYLNNVLKWI